jgi:hypothetical protein
MTNMNDGEKARARPVPANSEFLNQAYNQMYGEGGKLDPFVLQGGKYKGKRIEEVDRDVLEKLLQERPRYAKQEQLAIVKSYLEARTRVRICTIIIGTRHRKDMGDLKALAESIDRNGLLHPVVITPEKRLVAGARRLRACRDILKWTEIEARILDVPSLLAGEHDENEVRKDFTPSERVALADALRQEMGNRQGQRTDLADPTRPDQRLPHDGAEVEPARETREAVARRAGFGSREEHRRARRVVERGVPDLVEAMDQGSVSIAAAAEVAALPPAEQQEAVAAGAEAVREKAKEVRTRQRPGGQEPATGTTLQALEAAWAGASHETRLEFCRNEAALLKLLESRGEGL